MEGGDTGKGGGEMAATGSSEGWSERNREEGYGGRDVWSGGGERGF